MIGKKLKTTRGDFVARFAVEKPDAICLCDCKRINCNSVYVPDPRRSSFFLKQAKWLVRDNLNFWLFPPSKRQAPPLIATTGPAPTPSASYPFQRRPTYYPPHPT